MTEGAQNLLTFSMNDRFSNSAANDIFNGKKSGTNGDGGGKDGWWYGEYTQIHEIVNWKCQRNCQNLISFINEKLTNIPRSSFKIKKKYTKKHHFIKILNQIQIQIRI